MEPNYLPPTKEEITELSRLLASPYLKKQADGKRLLQRMGPRGTEALLLIIRGERGKWHLPATHSRGRAWFALAVALVLYLIPVPQTKWFAHFSLLTCTWNLLLSTCGRGMFCSTLHLKSIEQLVQSEDLRSVGALIENMDLRRECIPALMRLLPRLKESDAALLNSDQLQRLYLELEKSYTWQQYRSLLLRLQKNFILTILKALEQIGDAGAIPYVQKAAERTPDAAIQAAARECLPFLQNRAHQRRMAETLLRPSQPDTPPNMLLRPAVTTTEPEPQQLLRASSESDAGTAA